MENNFNLTINQAKAIILMIGEMSSLEYLDDNGCLKLFGETIPNTEIQNMIQGIFNLYPELKE